MKCSLGVFNFLEEIAGLSQSIVFLYLFKKAFLSLLGEKRSIYSLKPCIQLVNQSCVILCDPMELLPGSSVYGILQERILEWVAIPLSRGSSQPRD